MIRKILLCSALFTLTGLSCAQADPPRKVDADARIAQHRKASLKIVVMNGSGTAMPGVSIEVRKRKHDFKFGTAIGANVLANAQNGDREYYA